MPGGGVEQARRRYAAGLARKVEASSPAIEAAFAAVPREDFLGPPPWIVIDLEREPYQTSDPCALYRDVLVAIDPERGLNNGEPSLWARLFDALALRPGQRAVHVGAGTGYYSAVLAELVGRQGGLEAIEIDPGLAARTQCNLAPWPQARAVAGDGFTYRPQPPADAIVVSAGVTALPGGWLDGLAADGQLLVPFTAGGWRGGFLLIRRPGEWPAAAATRYPARHISRTAIIPCTGGRTPRSEAKLAAALARSDLGAVRSLRRAPERPDATCWLEGDGWWLSTGDPAPPEP